MSRKSCISLNLHNSLEVKLKRNIMAYPRITIFHVSYLRPANCSVNRAFDFVAEAKSYWFCCCVAEWIRFDFVVGIVYLRLTNNRPWLTTFPTRFRTLLPIGQVPSVMCSVYAKSKVAVFISNFLVHWKQIIRKDQKTENNDQIQEINKVTRILIN